METFKILGFYTVKVHNCNHRVSLVLKHLFNQFIVTINWALQNINQLVKKNSFLRKIVDVSTILSASKPVCHRKYDIYPTDKTFIVILPSCLGENHLCSNSVEFLPQILSCKQNIKVDVLLLWRDLGAKARTSWGIFLIFFCRKIYIHFNLAYIGE